MQYSTAEALTTGAGQPGGNVLGAGVGAGIGMAMAGQMAGQFQGVPGPWGHPYQGVPHTPATGPALPPPPPVEKVWHIANNGETSGPFSRAALGRMAQEGSLTRESLVWTAGLEGWKAADEVDELAQLFTIAPPPLPSA